MLRKFILRERLGINIMKKVIRLIGVQLWANLFNMLSIGEKRGKKPKALYVGLIAFVALMGSLAFFYSFMIGTGLKMYDSINLLPALMMAVTSIIVLLTTVFKVKGTIFGFRDYDMVMSLPISTGGIAASRLAILYSFDMVFVIIIIIPMMIAYGILAKPEVTFYLIGFLTMFMIPLIPIIIASFLGTIITYVASKFRHSNLVNIIISLAFLVAIMGFSFTMGGSGQELLNMSRTLMDQVNSIYPLAELYTKAVCTNDILAFLSFTVISVAAFLIYAFVFGKIFKKINTIIMTGRYHMNYKMGELRQSSPMKALYHKELKRYFASTIYVLNTGFGIVMLTAGAIALIFVDLDKVLGDVMVVKMLKTSIPMFVSFCIVTCCTTMASISLEGRSLWVIKSLPVTPKTIFLSKLAVNMTILVPAFIDAILIGFILKAGFVKSLFIILVAVVCAIFTALFGLVVNLKFPNFSWTTETVVVKQSVAAMIAIFTGMGVVGLQFLFLNIIPSFDLAYLIYTCMMIIVDIVLYRILMTWGEKRFTVL